MHEDFSRQTSSRRRLLSTVLHGLAIRRGLAVTLALGAAFVLGSARADAADDVLDDLGGVDRPLTLPKRTLAIFGDGGVRHEQKGTVEAASTVGAAYGITDRFQTELDALSFQYTPKTRFLGPNGSATYAFLERGAVLMGARLRIGAVVSPATGGLTVPSLPIAIVFAHRVRLDLEPQVPIVIAAKAVVGVVTPLGVSVQLTPRTHVRVDTAMALYDVTARTATVPLRFSAGATIHPKIPLSIDPFFGFPTLLTPGDLPKKWHPSDYGGGLAVSTWLHL